MNATRVRRWASQVGTFNMLGNAARGAENAGFLPRFSAEMIVPGLKSQRVCTNTRFCCSAAFHYYLTCSDNRAWLECFSSCTALGASDCFGPATMSRRSSSWAQQVHLLARCVHVPGLRVVWKTFRIHWSLGRSSLG